MDYLHGHLAEAYFHDQTRRQREDVRARRENWLQSMNAMGQNGEPMQTGVATVKFVDVVDRAWLEIPGDFSRAISLVISLKWNGARKPPPRDAPLATAHEGTVALRLYDRIGDSDAWWTISNTAGAHTIAPDAGTEGFARGRYIEPIGSLLAAELILGRFPLEGSPPGELDEATLELLWRGF